MAPGLPTDAELEILRVLWSSEPCAVRDVHEAILSEGRAVAYTTVLKTLQIMTDKGLVHRDESSRAHLYRSALPRPETQKQLVDDLVDRAFGGAAMELVIHALAGRKSSPSELSEIKRLLKQMEKSSGGKS